MAGLTWKVIKRSGGPFLHLARTPLTSGTVYRRPPTKVSSPRRPCSHLSFSPPYALIRPCQPLTRRIDVSQPRSGRCAGGIRKSYPIPSPLSCSPLASLHLTTSDTTYRRPPTGVWPSYGGCLQDFNLNSFTTPPFVLLLARPLACVATTFDAIYRRPLVLVWLLGTCRLEVRCDTLIFERHINIFFLVKFMLMSVNTYLYSLSIGLPQLRQLILTSADRYRRRSPSLSTFPCARRCRRFHHRPFSRP